MQLVSQNTRNDLLIIFPKMHGKNDTEKYGYTKNNFTLDLGLNIFMEYLTLPKCRVQVDVGCKGPPCTSVFIISQHFFRPSTSN